MPIRPVEALETKRTGPQYSRVAPKVMSTRFPRRRGGVRARSTSRTIRLIAARRPSPTAPLAKYPFPGGISRTCESRKRRRRSACTTGCRYIFVSIAGASRTGRRAAKNTADSKSSHKPWASFAIVCAVAGAIRNTSAFCAKSICCVHAVSPPEKDSHKSPKTGCRERDSSACAETKFAPLSLG